MSFVDPASDWYSASVPAIIHAISYYTEPRYNDTRLCYVICVVPDGSVSDKRRWFYSTIRSGPWFNINMMSYRYRKSHCGDKTVVRSSYLHNGISYTGKMTSLYWIGALVDINTDPVQLLRIVIYIHDDVLTAPMIAGISNKRFQVLAWKVWWYALAFVTHEITWRRKNVA